MKKTLNIMNSAVGIMLAAVFALASSCSKPSGGDNPGGGSGSGGDNPGGTTEQTVGTFCTDESIVLDLGMPAVLGSSGHISIYKSDGKKVDDIDLADLATVTVRDDGYMVPKEQATADKLHNTFFDCIGPTNGNQRIVHYTPVYLDGSTVTICPHSNVLDFNTEYYVTVDEGVFVGFKGIAAGEKTFCTRGKPKDNAVLTVGKSGNSDFYTVQGALSYAMSVSNTAAVTVKVASGVYKEMLYLSNRSNVTVKGFSRSAVRISYPNSEVYMYGSSARCLFLVENCDKLHLENITIDNCFGLEKGQAEAIYFNSGSNKHHLTAENCAFISLQDTFLCKGICYLHGCLIEGGCDYIWGYPAVCLFENCEIRSVAKGYIVQARVQSKADKGFVFLNCKLTAGSGLGDETMWLARSGGSSDYYDNVLFVNCTMASAIRKAGWCVDNNKLPNPSAPTASAGWREYSSTTVSGASASGARNAYGRVLTDTEAAPYLSKDLILN